MKEEAKFKSFSVFESYVAAFNRISTRKSKAELADAIFNFGIYCKEPNPEKISEETMVAFMLIKPIIENSHKKALNGKIGGSQKRKKTTGNVMSTDKERQSGTQTFSKQSKSKSEANVKPNERDKEKESRIGKEHPLSDLEKEKLILAEISNGHPNISDADKEFLVQKALATTQIWRSCVGNKRAYINKCLPEWIMELEDRKTNAGLENKINKMKLDENDD